MVAKMDVIDFLHGMPFLLSLLCILQVTFLECTRHSGPKKPLSDGIACALKVLCSEKQDFKKQQMWVAKSTELKDQCPIQVDNFPSERDMSLLDHDSFVAQDADSSISREHHSGRKVVWTVKGYSI